MRLLSLLSSVSQTVENITTVNEFLLLELTCVQELQPVIFMIFLILYIVNLLGNGAILAIVLSEPRLHSPMYFFLGNLSCLDICYSSVTMPKLMANFLSSHRAISFVGCITQLHFFHFLGCTEALLLTIMGFDRFMAICNPLHYPVIMNLQLCVLLAAVAWITSFFYALMHSVMTAHLNFCHSQKLNYFFCDVKPLLELALLKNRSCSMLQKAMSTCASHFMVVCLFFGTVALNYIPPTSATSVIQEKFVGIIHTTVTPVLNPLIYTLRNKEVMLALSRFFQRKLKLFA
ncbi:olfactory receptor 12D3-like [Castor canadensis]|uniref:Olfactory receptor 12D3-like n=1 Tax=Castor canadensis TaxID=51338 RepID=A0AC58NH22_CASCN